jgi:hypothetical protein
MIYNISKSVPSRSQPRYCVNIFECRYRNIGQYVLYILKSENKASFKSMDTERKLQILDSVEGMFRH